jgi:hypothetical protein
VCTRLIWWPHLAATGDDALAEEGHHSPTSSSCLRQHSTRSSSAVQVGAPASTIEFKSNSKQTAVVFICVHGYGQMHYAHPIRLPSPPSSEIWQCATPIQQALPLMRQPLHIVTCRGLDRASHALPLSLPSTPSCNALIMPSACMWSVDCSTVLLLCTASGLQMPACIIFYKVSPHPHQLTCKGLGRASRAPNPASFSTLAPYMAKHITV